MITIGLDAGGLARSRFVLSRLAELTNGLEVLSHPERAPYAHRWVETTRPQVDVADLAVLLGLVDHSSWYVPDFLVPIAGEYAPTLARELDAVATAPAELVRYQLRMAFRIGPPPPDALRRSGAGAGRDPRAPLSSAVADVLAAGESVLAECVAEQLARCWRRIMAASWPAIHRILDGDVRHRAERASRVGFGGIVDGLHPQLGWDGTRLTVRRPVDVSVDTTSGVVLVPSVFLPSPALWLGAPGQAMIGYPARGRGRVWAMPQGPAAGTVLLGHRRAALLGDLDTPRSTTELAARHRLSPATVSYHLARLRQAGLVTRRQSGHAVLYQRTDRVATLLAVVDPEPD
ncbi:ArsR family transcriptional regulator [Micromonospora sonneratiae]